MTSYAKETDNLEENVVTKSDADMNSIKPGQSPEKITFLGLKRAG